MGLVNSSGDIDVVMSYRCWFGMRMQDLENTRLIRTTEYMEHLWADHEQECAHRYMPCREWDEVGNKYLTILYILYICISSGPERIHSSVQGTAYYCTGYPQYFPSSIIPLSYFNLDINY